MPTVAGQVLGGIVEICVEYQREWAFILIGPVAMRTIR